MGELVGMEKVAKMRLTNASTLKPDSLEAIKYQKRMMIWTGMWPLTNRSLTYQMRNVIVFLINISGTLLLTIEMYVQIGHLEAFTNIASIWISLLCTIVKNFIYEFKREDFKDAIKKLNEPIFKEYPDELDAIMKRTIRKSIKISGLYQIACAFSLTLLLSGQYFVWPVKPLYPITFIEVNPIRNLFIHIFQTVTLICCAANNSCLDTVSGGFITIATGYFKILNAKIKHARKWTRQEMNAEEVDDECVNKWLGHCVKQHIAILSFIELIEKNFSIGYLVQFCGSIIVICNSGFQIVHVTSQAPDSSHLIVMLMYLVAMIIQLCLYCWLGNELFLESIKILDSCYMSDWVDLGTNVRKTLFIIMEHSKRPVYLTAGKYANLSLDSFKAILKSAYSYFALMQTLYSKSEDDLVI